MDMLTFLFRMLEQLFSFFRISRANLRDRFEKVDKPLFEDAQTVHGDYLQIFAEVHTVLNNTIVDINKLGKKEFKVRKKTAIAFAVIETLIRTRRLIHEARRKKLWWFKDKHQDGYLTLENNFHRFAGSYACQGETFHTQYTCCTYVLNNIRQEKDLYKTNTLIKQITEEQRYKWDELVNSYMILQAKTYARRPLFSKRLLLRRKRG